MTETQAPPLADQALFDALWQEVADHGWQGLSLGRLAEAAGTDLATLRDRMAGRLGLLCAHARWVDRQVLADMAGTASGTPRDRLFDLLMRRLDLLQPHRAGLIRLGRDMRHDPLLALALAPQLAASMAWMLEAAGIETGGLAGLARVKGLGVVWMATLRAWEQDETTDLGSTMAALDRALDRAERLARTLRLAPSAEPAADPAAAAAS